MNFAHGHASIIFSSYRAAISKLNYQTDNIVLYHTKVSRNVGMWHYIGINKQIPVPLRPCFMYMSM